MLNVRCCSRRAAAGFGVHRGCSRSFPLLLLIRDELADRPRGWSAAGAAPGHAVRECFRDACTPRHRPDRVAERRSLVCDSLFGDVLQPIWCRSGASTGNCTFASALLGCTYELLRERCMFRKLSNVFMRVVLTVSSYLVDMWTRFFPSPGLIVRLFRPPSSSLLFEVCFSFRTAGRRLAP